MASQDNKQHFSRGFHSLRRFKSYASSASRASIDDPPTPATISSLSESFVQDLQKIGDHGKLSYDLETLISMLRVHYLDGGVTNDKEFLMERLIQMANQLDSSVNGVQLTRQLIDKLWNSLQHPPLSYLGNKFQFRMPDGSYNNIMYEKLGMANTPYARSVRPKRKMLGAPPDAGLLFDTLLARDEIREHPNKISSMLFYLASIIIHDLFRTSHKDPSVSTTSSYLDLSPLYGSNADDQKRVRTFKDGKMKPDSYAEKRLLGFPPGVSVLMIMFCRFHNHVVDILAKIDPAKRFSGRLSPEQRDEKLFQTGRLVTCGLYINIVLGDYIRVILNLARTKSSWFLDPRAEINKVFSETGTPQGIGNQVSAEFNLIYRWHHSTSARDEKWAQNFYGSIFGEKQSADISTADFVMGAMGWEKTIDEDPANRVFAGLKRNADGKFDDADLLKIYSDSIEDVAGAFGAKNIPKIMRTIEVLGIEQSRAWELASLNEFRAFFDLKEYETFEEINPDPEIADALRQFYDHPDNVELYPGLIVEDAKPQMVPGSGLCTGYTISRAILSDAVALVRGDRFYTVDYTTGNLTNFGMEEVTPNPDVAYGCVFHKLAQTAFPSAFKYNSVYSTYPFTVPAENKKIFEELGIDKDYNYDRPIMKGNPFEMRDSSAVEKILTEEDLDSTWQTRASEISGEQYTKQDKLLKYIKDIPDFNEHVKNFFRDCTRKMIQQAAGRLGKGYWMDAVRDVANVVPTYFALNLFQISLKIDESKTRDDVLTPHDLHSMFSAIATYVFREGFVPQSKVMELRDAAKSFWSDLLKNKSSTSFDMTKVSKKFEDRIPDVDSLKKIGKDIFTTLFHPEPEENITSEVMMLAARMSTGIGRAFSQILEFYLSREQAENWDKIQHLAQAGDASDAILQKYVLEGLRLCPEVEGFSVPVTNAKLAAVDRSLKEGDDIYINFASANRDENRFSSATTVNPDRPIESYIKAPRPGVDFAIRVTALTAMLKEFASLANLRRAAGPQGELKFVNFEGPGGIQHKLYMDEEWSSFSLNPASMKVQFDGHA